jgi:hypothetical protein
MTERPGFTDFESPEDWIKEPPGTDEARQKQQRKSNGEEPASDNQDTDEVQLAWPPITPIDQIPPRQWAYGKFLLFGSAAVIGAQDGTGKGLMAVTMALAIITGLPLLGERVWRTGRVAIISYEDDVDEWRRRFAAACLEHKLDFETVMRSVAFLTKLDSRIVLAERTLDGLLFPDSERIIHLLKANNFALLIIDPFNNAHAMADGNNNVDVAAVAQEISHIARASKLAALVLHHLRKGASGDTDDLMGAVALRANFRSCRILVTLREDEGEKLGIKSDFWRYLRVAGTKANYTTPLAKATLFKLVSIQLGNSAGIYTEGDEVGALIRWEPPAMFEGMNGIDLRAVFDALTETPHGNNPKVKVVPWVCTPLIELAERSQEQAIKIVKAWIDNGVLIDGPPAKSKNGSDVKTLVPVPAKVAEILAAGVPRGSNE